MSTVIDTFPNQSFPVGSFSSQPRPTPVTATKGIGVTISRSALPEGILMDVFLWQSLDGGITWFYASTTMMGGIILDKHGNVLTNTSLEWDWSGHADENGNRVVDVPTHVKISATIYIAFTASVTFEAF